MPYGDKTGPEGRGPKTGRGMGFCAGNDFPGCRGGGRGRMFQRNFQPPVQTVQMTDAEQAKVLEAEKAEVSKRLKAIDTRLKELKR